MPNPAYKYDVMKREELIDGKIVMMSPRPAINHERIQRNILRIFDNYLHGKRCEAFGEAEVWLDEKNHFILMWQKTPCLYRREMNATSTEFTQVIEVDNRT